MIIKEKIFFGPEPHVYDSEYKDKYEYMRANVHNRDGKLYWGLLFDNMTVTKDSIKEDGNNKYLLNDKVVNFDINSGLIIGTSEYQNLIEDNFFKELIVKNICTKNYVTSIENNVKYLIYSCDENLFTEYNGLKDDQKLSYIKAFPQLELNLSELSYIFTLSGYDLFKLIEQSFYFLIVFESDNKNNNIWKFGQPFLKKYQLIFDLDSKTIGFYERIEYQNNEEEDENAKKGEKNIEDKITKNIDESRILKYILYVLFGILIILVVIIAFFLGMKIKEGRKKRANELKDDDYDYNSHQKNEKNNNEQSINNFN